MSVPQFSMAYRNLKHCIDDLRQTGQLLEYGEQIDPYLEIAAVQKILYREKMPAVLFTSVKNCRFPMLANLYGTEQRINYIFRDGIEPLQKVIEAAADFPASVLSPLSKPKELGGLLKSFYYSRPKRISNRRAPVFACRTTIERLPQLVSWQDDGGAYLTLPQVYTEHPNKPGTAFSNLGMYRVQLSGNDYVLNQEVGLHYQIQRGIAAHHIAASALNQPLRVSIFIGGAPSMTLAAVMPMPEDISELLFAGILGRHRIPMTQTGDTAQHSVYAEADFCITGTLQPEMKREGPFGDHLGYYSLAHEFPVLKVDGVYHRRDAVLPFTVVGRPPQEDTEFGKLIHRITGNSVTKKIPGVQAVHAVDEAGVHPLLLAVGRETYPNELHTLAHGILGFGQLSLAKYLLIAAPENGVPLDVYNVPQFFRYVLERADWRKDIHFVTKTSMDTLDYSGEALNKGSKVFIAVNGKPIRQLAGSLERALPCKNPRVAMPGVLCVEQCDVRHPEVFGEEFPLIVWVDDSVEASSSIPNFLWTTFTKSDPAKDIYGIGEFIRHKHWGCTGPLLIDARRKAHHAPELFEPPEITKRAVKIVQNIQEKCQ